MPRRNKSAAEKKAAEEAKAEADRIAALKSKLIEWVRQYPLLYDTAHEDHKNAGLKSVVWDLISEKMGIDGKCLEIVKCLKTREE